MKEIEIERKKLSETLEIIKKLLSNEEISLEDLYKNFDGPVEDLWRSAHFKKIHITNLKASIDKPYFARIDFISDENGKTNSIYIGKHGISKDTDIIVTDWRAPISSLYYDSEIGKCSYSSPSGVISGEMTLKRQYEIEQGELLEYFDVDLVSNDSLLQKYLNSNNDARLKSIVATIQKEQNEVIRRQLFKNLIIQGVAGSGKTTVALHRIAYLVYNYINSVQQNQYLVIGPNPVFMKYIKSVLPELDVADVDQCTFEQFAQKYIDEDFTINPSDKKVIASISGKINHDVDKFKCSIKYKNMIDKFLDIYFYSLTSSDLKVGDVTIIDSAVIRSVFKSVSESSNSNLSSKIEKTIEILYRYIEENNQDIMSKYDDYCFRVFENATTTKEKDNLRAKFVKEKGEISKNCKNVLKKYFSKAKISPIKLYKLFISSINDFDIYGYKNLSILKRETLSNIKKGSYDFEDLAALMYIKMAIFPDKDYEKIKHVVIDEAQDLGEFNFLVLKKALPSATFSIFGDLAQSIFDYRGINNWQEVNNIMFDNKGEIVNFGKSYRTTSEIMGIADDVAESIGLNRSDLVVRHGNQVNIGRCENEMQIADYIVGKVKEFKEKGYKTIAIISKTNLLSRYINDDLAERGLFIPNIGVDDDLSDEKFNVCTISNQLAKGLEFDAVIINNANETIYSSENNLDMKLLYVAITRALHELDIVYTDELTKPLQKSLSKDKILTLK